jgi:hypothetical protein
MRLIEKCKERKFKTLQKRKVFSKKENSRSCKKTIINKKFKALQEKLSSIKNSRLRVAVSLRSCSNLIAARSLQTHRFDLTQKKKCRKRRQRTKWNTKGLDLPSARKKHTSTFRHFFVFFGIQKI